MSGIVDPQGLQSNTPLPSDTPQKLVGKSLPLMGSQPETGNPEDAIQTPPPALPNQIDQLSRFAEGTHQYVREYISLADQKAAFIFAASVSLLAFLYKANLPQHWLKSPGAWSFGDFLAFLSMFGLGLAAMICVAVVNPRLPGSRRGYVFWDSIAEFGSSTQYSENVSKLNPAELAAAKLEHCYELSKVCRQKYCVLKISIYTGWVGLAATVIYLLFFRQ